MKFLNFKYKFPLSFKVIKLSKWSDSEDEKRLTFMKIIAAKTTRSRDKTSSGADNNTARNKRERARINGIKF
jgi:hypothetical protein